MTDNSKCCGLPLADSGYCVNNPWHEQAAEMTGPVIPPEAVEAAAKAQHGLTEADWSAMSDSARAYALAGVERSLQAALPRLRVQGCAKSDQICGDCNALPGRDHSPSCVINIEGAKALIATATKLGRQLGRQEAAEEIAAGFERRAKEPKLRGTREGTTLLVCATAAREVATRTADARTDPSGHTDLPPTPDALSNRLPEDAP